MYRGSIHLWMLGFFSLCGIANGQASIPQEEIYVINVEQPPIVKIPKSFLGFSINYPDLESFSLQKGKINSIFVNLCYNLEPRGNGPVSLRIGGRSTDSSWWNPSGALPPPGIDFSITKEWTTNLRNLTSFTGSGLILGLNMAQDNPQIAIEWAVAAHKILSSSRIITYEVGNAPDLYGVAPYPGGKYVQPGTNVPIARPSTWSFSDYLSDFNLFSTSIKAAFPKALLAGQVYAKYKQDIYSPFFLINQPEFLASQGSKISSLTQQIYPLDGCYPENLSMAELLSPSSSDEIGAIIAPYTNMGFPMRVTELNSASCGGIAGISNSFGSALWMTDVLFELAKAGVKGVNIPLDNNNVSTPFSFYSSKEIKGRTKLSVNPIYYGMLLFTMATGSQHRLLSITPPSGADPLLKVWATLDGREEVFHIVVINKNEGSGSSDIAIYIPGTKRRSFWISLEAPGCNVYAQKGITLEGKTFDSSQDGHIHGKAIRNPLVPTEEGFYLLKVPNSSAILLTVPSAWHSE